MKGGLGTLMLATMMLKPEAVEPFDFEYPESYFKKHEKKEDKSMPLTDDEAFNLFQLSGKEKKAFVKQLKQKYGR